MILALHAFVCTLSCTMVHILCSLCCWAALVQLEEARLLRPHRWLSKVFLSFVLLASRDGSGKPKNLFVWSFERVRECFHLTCCLVYISVA